MTTTFDDNEHYDVFTTGASTGTFVRVKASEKILKALKQAGLLWNLYIGDTAPDDTTKVWLDKSTIPDTVRVYNVATEEWEEADENNTAFAKMFGLSTPGLINPEINPFNYGATGGDPDKDTAGWLAALADARVRNRPVVPTGTTVVKTPEVKSFDLYTTRATYIALPLLPGDRIFSKDATIFLSGATTWTPTGGPTGQHIWVMGTANWSTTRGANGASYHIEGITIDMSPDEYPRADTFHYAFGFLSADEVVRRNVKIISSGTNAGRGAYFANTRYRIDEDIYHDNLRQGMYTHYDYGAMARGLRFKQQRECLDLDAMQEASTFRDLLMYDPYVSGVGGESDERQGIDMSPGRDVLFDGIHAEKLKTVFQVYGKNFIPPTFAEYVQVHEIDNTTYSNSLGSRKVTYQNFRHIECGQNDEGGAFGSEDIKINVPRNNSGGSDPETKHLLSTNIHVRNGVMYKGHGLRAHECDGLFLENIEAIECSGNNSYGSAGDIGTGGDLNGDWDFVFVVKQEDGPIGTNADRQSRLRGKMSNIYVKNTPGGGVYVGGPAEFDMENISVEGYGKSPGPYNNKGIFINRLGQKENSNVRLNGLIKVTDGPVGGQDFRLSGQASAPAGDSILDLRGAHIVANNVLVTLTDRVRLRGEQFSVGILNLDASPTWTRTLIPALPSDTYFYIHTFEVANVAAYTGDPSNYTTARLRKSAGGTLTSLGGTAIALDDAAVAADTRRLVVRDLDDAIGTIGPGEALVVEGTETGTSAAIPDAFFIVTGFFRRKVASA